MRVTKRVAAVVALALLPLALPTASVTTAQAVAPAPNIVLITTDDMTDYDLSWMPKTKRLLRDQGTQISDFISPHPLCCPARAEIVSGQYAHNNGVRHNRGTWGGYQALRNKDNNIGKWLDDAGYDTAMIGKFINGYQPRFGIPAGWDFWNPYIERVYSPYNFTVHNNGNRRLVEGIHTNDYVGNSTAQFVRDASGGSPFFVWASFVAPHGMLDPRNPWAPPIPAPRHDGLLTNVRAPSLAKPSFNEERIGDKPNYFERGKVNPAKVQRLFTERIQSLLSVDDAVGRLVRTLRQTGELDNTVILFTSDNGYHLGEHRFAGKNTPYEESLQVPLVARGPGIPVGRTVRQTATLVDLAATFLDLGNATAGRTQDGRSLMPILNGASGYGPHLIQAGRGNRPWLFRGVRTSRWTYVRHYTGEVELYDRLNDPYQNSNVAGRRPATQQWLHNAWLALEDCQGTECY
jgi:arylsulfatase A-like enzyme